MSRGIIPTVVVGNEFAIPQPRLQVSPPTPVNEPAAVSLLPAMTASAAASDTRKKPLQLLSELFHRYSVGAFAVLFLLVGAAGLQVGGSYWSVREVNKVKPAVALSAKTRTIAGLNLAVPTGQLQEKIQEIISQPASLTVGEKTAPLDPDEIKSWLLITSSPDKSRQYIHIKADTISKTLAEAANKYVKTPVDQVTITHEGVPSVVVGGRNGTKLTDPGTLTAQATAVAKTVMDAKGMQFTTPMETVPFQALTPANFSKLIETNVVTKQMYLYDNGQLTRSYPISAGAPETPTPLGQYKTYSKLTIQDMKGFNPNGTKYLQPNVRWIMYFKYGGYAVHGNYWRPASWFGAINSSHGCVSLPESQAKEVYDWAPVGTTVINHT